jgi:DNA-binding SARP family transcriptional activator
MPASLSMQLLGPPHLRMDGSALEFPTRKLLALVSYLALHGGTSRAEIVALLWSGQPSAEGRRNLRQELHRMRSTPLSAWLVTEEDRLHLKAGFELDVERWRVGLTSPDADLADGPPTLLDGLDIKGADGFADWLERERESLRRQWMVAAARQAMRCEQDGRLDDALRLVRAQLAQQPTDEPLHRQAMQLLHRQGHGAAALEQFETCRELLQRELQVAPDAETMALERRIRSAHATPAAAAATAAEPLHAPLIGRDSTWARLLASGARVRVIEGEPGVGKSRLATDFAQAGGGCLVVKGREISRETALYPIADALLAAYQASSEWFERLDPAWRAEVARLVPSLADDETKRVVVDLPLIEARTRFLEGLSAALLTAAGSSAIVIDDLQWFDSASAELFAHLARRSQRTVLLVTARPDELSGNTAATRALQSLEREQLVERIVLNPLAQADVLALVRALSGSNAATMFSRRLHGATAGNPLFILESLRELFAAGALWREHGTWATPYDDDTDDYRELPIAGSVRDAVLGRIDRLGEPTRRALDAACLAGDGFHAAWIASCVGLSEIEAVDAIERALRADLLVETAGGLRFAHDLIRRALDDALSGTRRQLLHRALAAAMEATQAPPADVAHHLEAGGRPIQAIEHRVRAAEAAARLYALPEALMHYDAALSDGAVGEAAFSIHAARLELHRNLGDEGQRQACLDAMAALAAADGNAEHQLDVAIKRTVAHFENDRYDDALRCATEAMQALDGRIDPLGAAALMLEMGATLKALGRIDEAEQRLAAALERFRGHSRLKEANCAYWLCQCALQRGDLEQARTWCDHSLQATAAAGYRRGHALSLWTSAEILLRSGSDEAGLARIGEALSEAHAIGSVPLQRGFLDELISHLRRLGRGDEAERAAARRASLQAR